MGKVHYRTFYHLVWSTKHRLPLITPRIETALKSHMISKLRLLQGEVIEAGMPDDHCHLVAMIPPSHSVSTVVGQIKGSSSHFLNHESGLIKNFDWQDGFAAFTVSEKELPRVIEYVRNQRRHHQCGDMRNELELPMSD